MPQGPTITYQGGQPMVRSNPAAESWGAFLRARLAALGMSQADFRRAMEREGFPISKQAASQWFNGENAADANTATVAASVLQADPAEAMRAAGYATAVERMRLGGNAQRAAQPVDPIVEEIMAMTHLGIKVRQALVTQYLTDQEDVRRRARNLARVLPGDAGDGGDEPENAA